MDDNPSENPTTKGQQSTLGVETERQPPPSETAASSPTTKTQGPDASSFNGDDASTGAGQTDESQRPETQASNAEGATKLRGRGPLGPEMLDDEPESAVTERGRPKTRSKGGPPPAPVTQPDDGSQWGRDAYGSQAPDPNSVMDEASKNT
ncbi:hypothetical protein IAT40_007205 [Kwoniella sp. CBS 6097]